MSARPWISWRPFSSSPVDEEFIGELRTALEGVEQLP